jgi:CheY-like chemotaxis protein
MPRASTILLVDDSPRDVELILRAIRQARLANRIELVTDGVAAMEYLSGLDIYADREKYPLPFLLLLDLRMPRLPGLDLLAWIRSRPDLKDLLVVILTSSTEDPDIARAYALGANAYLVKPGNLDQLVVIMKNLECHWEIFRNTVSPAAA